MKVAHLVALVFGAVACGSAGATSSNEGGAGGQIASGGGDVLTTGGAGPGEGAGGEGGIGGGGGYAPGEPDCHPRESSSAHGAYFRKVTSTASSSYLTLHTTGVLPRVIIDRARWFHTDDPSLGYQNGPLDRPSFYLGGRASGVEVDAGLTWDRVYDEDGRPTWTDELVAASDGGQRSRRFVVLGDGSVLDADGAPREEGTRGLVENFGFRPFWRAVGVWANPPVGSEDNVYFYPGEGLRMQIKAAGVDTLELVINSADDPSKTFFVSFDAPGWGRGEPQLFKRVHSIDQFTVFEGERVGLETADLDVLPTDTVLEDATWSTVRVLGTQGAELAVLDCDSPAVVGSDEVLEHGYDTIFLLYDQTPAGGERSVILPPRNP